MLMQRLKPVLGQAWLARTWLPRLLLPVALLYALLVRLRQVAYRRQLFKTHRFDAVVIVVGNIVAGGAGKTPLVVSLLQHLQAQGVLAGVVSRGYGRRRVYNSGAPRAEAIEVTSATPGVMVGDEPKLIKNRTGVPVFVADQRCEAVRQLLATYPETAVVICDDGLQHYALGRDLEIAVFDDRGVGNGWLLPAGPLREPWEDGTARRVDFVLHTGQHPAFGGFTSSRQLSTVAVDSDGRRIALESLANCPVVALAGIAVPSAFFSMLSARGLTLTATLALPDHHDFQDSTVQMFLEKYPGHTVLCTEKDAVKLFCGTFASLHRVLSVALDFSPAPDFFCAFDARLAPLLKAVTSQVPSLHGSKTS